MGAEDGENTQLSRRSFLMMIRTAMYEKVTTTGAELVMI